MMNNKDDDIRHQYEIKKYEQGNFPLSTHIEYPNFKVEEEVHMMDYLNVILKRKWIVLIFLISVFVTVIILTSMMTPLYKSSAVLKIEKENPNVLSFKDVVSSPDANYYSTQYEILKSRNLAERVIRQLSLDKNNDFMPVESKLDKIKRIISDNTIGILLNLFSFTDSKNSVKEKPNNNPPVKDEIPNYLSSALIGRLEIQPVKNSQLVNVSFISHNPELSMNVANAVAETYIAFDLESRVDASKDARDFLEKQIEITKEKLKDSETRLNDYASKNEIIFDRSKENLLTSKLSDISTVLNSVTTEKMQKEALYREVKESGANNPIILNNSLILGLKTTLSLLEAEYSNLSKTYTSDYPKMKSLKSQMDAIQKRIEQETSKLINSLQSDYNASLKKEENLTRAFNAQKKRVLSFQDKGAQFEVLKREVDGNKNLYNDLLQRHNEVGVSASSKATNIQILDKALYSKAPFKPDKLRNILLSIIFGLMGGIGLAFLVEYFDNSVKDTHDIEKEINLPILGIITNFKNIAGKGNLLIPEKIPLQKGSNPSTMPMILCSGKTSSLSEAFRSIGAFISLSSSSKPPKSILVTGPEEKIGKTTICLNIAMALMESLGNGIIIDADLRRPKLHNTFKLNNSIGLSSFLSGNIEFDGINGALVKPTSVKGLSVITSGPIPPNPSELLTSTRLQDLIYALYSVFEFIIIDSPPIMGLPDTIYLSKIVDGTVLVVKAGKTPKKALIEVKKVFRNINAKILGVVLNGVKKNDIKYGSYNFYLSSYYSSYFKEEEH
jgi:succinoglycan biosynthesis transport protein ExoP